MELPCKLIGDLQQKIYKRIPFNFELGPFYKGFPWIFFFHKEILCKIFPLKIYKGIPFKLVENLQQKNLQKNSL